MYRSNHYQALALSLLTTMSATKYSFAAVVARIDVRRFR